MIVVTGAAGFIASCLVGRLNALSITNELVLVDDFSMADKADNYRNKHFHSKIERSNFHQWLDQNRQRIEWIFHLGARTDTTEQNQDIFDDLNLNYSKRLWEQCCRYDIPLVYASSAATYGLGKLGFADDHDIVGQLVPLNPYGRSKNDLIDGCSSKHRPLLIGMD